MDRSSARGDAPLRVHGANGAREGVSLTARPAPRGQSSPDERPLLSQRTALVFLMAAFIGTGVGVLTFLSATSPAGAMLAGASGFGASTLALHKLISHDAH